MSQAQRVVVTGGARGIGLTIVQAFADAGHAVHICDANAPGLSSALADKKRQLSGTVCDITDPEAVESLVDQAVATMGGIDVLINNAALRGPTSPLEQMNVEAWQSVLDVNLTGTFNVTQGVIPHIKAAGGGSIIMMSSLAGRVGFPNRSPYAVSKWGLIGLTKTLALELGPDDIRVNALLPGSVGNEQTRESLQRKADLAGTSLDEVIADVMRRQSLKRFVDPEEIAQTCLFLASPAARSISGQAIAIDADTQSPI